MKRIVICVLILAGILGVCVWELIYFSRVRDEIVDTVDEIITSCEEEEYDELSEKIEELEKKWDKQEGIVINLVRYDRLEEVAENIAQLRPLFESGETGEFLAQAEKIKKIMKDAWIYEKPSLKNIF